jgi:hypothetical protein
MGACSSTYILIGRRIFYIFNLGIPVFLAYTAAAGLKELTSYDSSSTATVFQCVYMLLFAALLFIFEAVQICPCEMFDNIIKRNFGFFYGVFGKGDASITCISISNEQLQIFLLSISCMIVCDLTVVFECTSTAALYTLMIGIFAYGLESPRQLSIACAVIVAAYGPFCILVHLAVSYFSQTKLFILHIRTYEST